MEKTFIKVKVALKNRSKALNRVIAVDPEISLFDFSLIALSAMEAEFDHLFQIMDHRTVYSLENCEGYKSIYHHTVKDVTDKFTLIYDFGQDWIFDCSKMKSVFEVEYDEGNFIGKVLSGKGMGIWEDNHYSFDAYYDGIVKPNSSKEYPDRDIYLPYNLAVEKYGDVDIIVDPDAYPDYYDADLDLIRDHYYEVSKELNGEAPDFSEPFELDDNMDLMYEFHAISNQIVTLAYNAAMLHLKMYPNQDYTNLVKEKGKEKADLIEAGLMLQSLSETLLEDSNFEVVDEEKPNQKKFS